MDFVEQNTTPLVSFTYSVDGVATDPTPDSATVTITRSDGTVLHTNAATGNLADGVFTYTLSASDTSLLDRLKLEWHIGTQTFTTYVEVAGGFYFTISEFKARYADNPEVAALPASQIADARATAEEIIEGLDTEDGTHVAFVPRAETFTFPGASTLSVPRYNVRSFDSVTVDGVSQDVSALIVDGGSIYSCGWYARQRVAVRVTHGEDAPPQRLKDAAMLLAYHRAVKGPIEDRAVGIASDAGVISLATPGLRGSVTGIPEVDAAIQQYRKPRIVAISVSLANPANLHSREWAGSNW